MKRAVLLVRAGDARYGLPLDGVERLVPTTAPLPAPGVPAVRGVVDVGDRLVPLVSLPAVLSGGTPPPNVPDAAVLVRVGARRVALEVDEAIGVVGDAPDPVPAGWDLPWALGVAHDGAKLIPIVDLGVVAARLAGDQTEDGA